jgi:hypothetical protein
MPNLPEASLAALDIIPILDVSEPLVADQNKHVTLEDLAAYITAGGGNSFDSIIITKPDDAGIFATLSLPATGEPDQNFLLVEPTGLIGGAKIRMGTTELWINRNQSVDMYFGADQDEYLIIQRPGAGSISLDLGVPGGGGSVYADAEGIHLYTTDAIIMDSEMYTRSNLYLLDVVGGIDTYGPVQIDAADSGGAGLRRLVVPNAAV